MYEGPIKVIIDDMCSAIQQKEDNYVMQYVQNIGIDVDKDELEKALRYDRQQYDKGYEDGFKDFKKVIEIVFSNMYPEYKEDELIRLLQPYKEDN